MITPRLVFQVHSGRMETVPRVGACNEVGGGRLTGQINTRRDLLGGCRGFIWSKRGVVQLGQWRLGVGG
jgi:hypothetical protein